MSDTLPRPTIDVAAADAAGLPILVGLPIPRGHRVDLSKITVVDGEGNARPTAAEAHVTWPDGSPRWVLLSFTATMPGAHAVDFDQTPPSPKQPVAVEQSDNRITLTNGNVSVTLSADGPSPITSLVAQGESVLASDRAFRLCVDEHSSELETQRTLTVMHSNPLRARVRIEGAHYSKDESRKVNYRLDVELWAGDACGSSSLRTDYHFINCEPGQDFLPVDRIAFECDYAMGEASKRLFKQVNHGIFYQPRVVENPDHVALVTDASRQAIHVEDEAMLRDDVDYPYYLSPPLIRTDNWLGVTDGSRSVYMTMQEIDAMRPKRLTSKGTSMAMEIWPPREGTLQLRQGRSRRNVITQYFAGGSEPDPAAISKQLNALVAEDRATINSDWIAHCSAFDQHHMMPYRSNVRLEKHFARLMRLVFTEKMFDFGDTPDSGYSSTYIPIGSRVPKQPNTPDMERRFTNEKRISDWSIPKMFEPVWTNNEYDAIFAFCTELMRTGRESYLPTIRQLVRHNWEVDFVHYSDHKWIHRATPQHSPDHVTSGAVPSHMWTQGVLAYFCLTGDDDAKEFAIALGDKLCENFYDEGQRAVIWKFTRELGWPVLALSHLADITGLERFDTLCREIVEFLTDYDLNTTETISLSGVNPRNSFIDQMVGSFFGFASMVEGIDHYLSRHPNKQQEAWLTNWLKAICVSIEQAHADGKNMHPTHMHNLALAIAFERTGDEHYLKVGMIALEEYMQTNTWQSPPPEVKPVAMLHRGLARFLGHAYRAGLVDELDFYMLRKLR